MRASRAALLAGFLLGSSLAEAEEPRGCDKFKWPIAHEQAALQASHKARVESGGAIALDTASVLRLQPYADSHLTMAPERAPKSPASKAGMASAPAPAAGLYKISV
jgi:hypothetical protein